MPNRPIEVATFSAIPSYVPLGVSYHTKDTGSLYVGTGNSTGPNVTVVNGSELRDITIGAACDGVTDDYAVLQANLTAAAGGVPWVPPLKTCGISQPLILPVNTGLYICAGATIKAIATMSGHGLVETGTARTANPEIWGGGTLDGNGKADYCFWGHNFAGIRIHDITAKGSNVYGLLLGDGGASYSDNAWITRCWIDRPGAVSIPASSAGIYFTNCGDSDIGGNTIINYDIGVDINSSNNMIHENHVWARLAYTQSFVDTGIGNIWVNNYADGPATYGFHFTSSANNFTVIGGKVYNGNTSVDNVLTGILIANAAPVGTVHGVIFYGFSGSNRINKDINSLSGYTNLNLSGNIALNTTTVNGQAAALSAITAATATGGSATLPANPVGFVEVNIAGTMYKLPYYAV